MYGYSFDTETGGLLLTDAIGQTSLEPRPVYAPEMDMLGFGDHWNYDRQNDVPSLGGGGRLAPRFLRSLRGILPTPVTGNWLATFAIALPRCPCYASVHLEKLGITRYRFFISIFFR